MSLLKIKKHLLIICPFIIYILMMMHQWYFPQIYHNGQNHSALISTIFVAFMVYISIVWIVLKTPNPIIIILGWNYLIVILSSHGLLINEVHIFRSNILNEYFLISICIALSVFLIAVMMIPSIKKIHFFQLSKKLILCSPFAIAAIQGLRRIAGQGDEFSLIYKVAIMLLALGCCYFIARINFPPYWRWIKQSTLCKRLVIAVFGGIVIFYITGFFQTPLGKTAKEYTVFDLKKIRSLSNEGQNVLFLVLDELSPEYIERLITPIEKSRLPYRVETIAAPTDMTIDAIPSLLTGKLYQDMVVCGFSTICSKSQKFDFSKLKAFESDIDVIGMHHPYCSIEGLRSCYTFSAFHRDPEIEFYCQFQHLLSMLTPEKFKKIWLPCYTEEGYRKQELSKSLEISYEMPFWKNGGVMYMHLPIPHPAIEGSDENRTRKDLETYYKNNIEQASKIVTKLLDKLASKFNNKFTLVITSDHSLRLGMWCGQHFECNPKPNIQTGIVPFIVISPTLKSDAVLPESQLNIFN